MWTCFPARSCVSSVAIGVLAFQTPASGRDWQVFSDRWKFSIVYILAFPVCFRDRDSPSALPEQKLASLAVAVGSTLLPAMPQPPQGPMGASLAYPAQGLKPTCDPTFIKSWIYLNHYRLSLWLFIYLGWLLRVSLVDDNVAQKEKMAAQAQSDPVRSADSWFLMVCLSTCDYT